MTAREIRMMVAAVERWERKEYGVMNSREIQPVAKTPNGGLIWSREDCLDHGGPATVLAALREKTDTIRFCRILAASCEIGTKLRREDWMDFLATPKKREKLIEKLKKIHTWD